ncbi:hypothetical protein AYO44_14725 [Planctomycetaceae bacterium SCGC AG-212-F19]|nr:hypothetical protein AYO44_14725 [Planctomycetaceae bacterium SCGC AG-212-F19]
MSAVVLTPSPVETPLAPVPPDAAPPARSPWLVNPWFDLCLFANCLWPLYGLAAVIGIQQLNATLTFWQMYLLATPHRWITLSLVFLDRERFDQRRLAYLSIMLFFLTLIVAALHLEVVALLVAVDWLWNAWHFAAQHSGIARIYNRQAHPADKGNGMFEKVVLRSFLVYVIVRLAGAPLMGLDRAQWLGWLDNALFDMTPLGERHLRPGIAMVDFLVLLLPALLLLREIWRYTPAALGRLVYLTSVCLLYTSVLVGVHVEAPSTHFTAFYGGMLMAMSVFHSTEYLAIVSWSVKKRHARSTTGVFAHLARYWATAIVTFMVVMALGAWLLDTHYRHVWVIITIFVSYLHYAYDGMIWKVRRPASASVA